MGGLNVFHFLSIPTPPKLQIPKPSFLQKQLSNPKTHFSPTTLNNPKSRKLNLNVSTEPITTPFAPEVETQGEGEKFDWFAHWYPVAPVSDLDKKVPHGKRVMGIDIVVWWDRNIGEWQVFEDKCPHRLAPLSEGRIDQWGRLQCVYHGWCFNGAGDCKFIPQAPVDGPQVIILWL
ncbi:hypothetical protein GIB67_019723 [Kingdonia uniflora]|uniref:Rieske domain-containing protein n=1 Tax=Kingdonia uniflora TaxID=39325 RepID=A0A7J7MK02_9MAGN|nr:hypothetical protein GIB67_019723 [Kingdonia uniflora]